MPIVNLVTILVALNLSGPPAKSKTYAEEPHTAVTQEELSHKDDHQAVDRPLTASAKLGKCMRASENRVEQVTLEFDVTEEGRVENIRVVDSTDHCFDETAINALEKWKYQPKLNDGEPAKQLGLRTVFEFKTDVAKKVGGSKPKEGGNITDHAFENVSQMNR